MILRPQRYSVNVKCQNNKNPIWSKCKLFTSIVNTTILVESIKIMQTKIINTVFKAKKNSRTLSTKILNVK